MRQARAVQQRHNCHIARHREAFDCEVFQSPFELEACAPTAEIPWLVQEVLPGEELCTFSRWGEPRDGHRVHPERAPKRARRDVYVFFDTTYKNHAPFDALALARRLGLPEPPGDLAPPPGRPTDG